MTSRKPMTACVSALLAMVVATSAAAQKVSCKDISAAMLSHASMPYHMYMTRPTGVKGKDQLSETVSVGGWMYVKVKGEWIKSPESVPEMVKQQREAADSVYRFYTCTHLGSENVNGVSAQRYHVEGKTDDGVKGEDIWVSSGGLIEQTAVDQLVDEGHPSQVVMTIRYVYTNVQPPPAAK